MTQPERYQDAKLKRILDSLKITEQQLLKHGDDFARGAVSSVHDLEPHLIRPSKTRWPFTWLWQINLDTLNTGLRNELDPLGVGYCYMLKSKGKLVHGRSFGWAQLPRWVHLPGSPQGPLSLRFPDDGSVGWAYHVPMNTCSVSKFITAIATVSLLRSLDISLKTSISDYLPGYWKPHYSVAKITFRDLLRHESGLGRALNQGSGLNSGSGPGNFATAKLYIEVGSAGTGTRDYKNLNFTLLRVLFATLTGTVEPDFKQSLLTDDSLWDLVSVMAYSNYVNETIFEAANIAPRQFKPDDIAAKAYGTPPLPPGARLEDVSSEAGSTGWHLSIGELTRLLSEFRRSGSIMSPRQAEQLLLNLYGLDGVDDTNAGPVYRKNGRYNDGDKTMDTAIYLMPNGVELAIFVNSGPGTGPNQDTYLARIPQLINDSVEFSFLT